MRLRPVQRSAQRAAPRTPLQGRFGATYPADSILHWDADIDAFSEQTGGAHTFNHAVLSPQYQRNADGSYANVGAKPAVDVFGGKKWLRSCGAITNLFGGDTSIARSVTLTAQAYTLQVFGAGTVSCSYGSASVGTPLTFMATAGATLFTPAGATYWMLTATAYPVPYVPPGVTQPASNATTTNGVRFSLPNGSPLWQALDGKPDGVELVANGVYKLINAEVVGDTITLTGASNEVSFSGMNYNIGTIVGQRYVAHISGVASVLTANETVAIRGVTGLGVIKSNEAFNFQHKFTATANYNTINIYGNGVGNIVITNVSIQRIQPQPLTLATRVRMGAGSGDIAANTALDGISCAASGGAVMRAQDISGAKYPASSNDGTTSALSPAITWSRNAVMRRFVQVNTAGTQFRVGYMIEGTHITIQWGSWTAYDGSFNPSTLYRLMLGYNNPYPMWFNKITAWKKQVTDAEILEAMA